MDSYIAEKYAEMLTKTDLKNVFDKIVQKLDGNRTKAARYCGLTTKATYDWEKAGFVKLETKQKVLQKLLEMSYLGTVEYLLNRSTERTGDLLHTALTTIYADAIEATGKESFLASFNHFQQFKMKHRGLIRDQVEFEIADMSAFLEEKALEFGIMRPNRLIEDMSAPELLGNFQLMGKYYGENPSKAEHFALEELGLPWATIEPIIHTFENVCFERRFAGPSETVEMTWLPTCLPEDNHGAKFAMAEPAVATNPLQGW
jgi:hypothetical protein